MVVPLILTSRPSANARTSSSVAAIPSTAPISTASLAAEDTASSTVDTAHSTFRPRASAMARDLGDRVIEDLVAEGPGDVAAAGRATGEAAPMFVPGAITPRGRRA